MQVERRKGTGLWRLSSPARDAMLVAEVQRNPSVTARDFKAATGFPGQKSTLIQRLKATGLRARHVAVKELFTDERKLYRLAFAENNLDSKWDRVIFSDESTFISANYGPVLVYSPRGESYNSTCKGSGRVSLHFGGWNSHKRVVMLHRMEGHLDGLPYEHTVQNTMVPSVR